MFVISQALMNACQDCLKIYRSELSGQRGTTNIIAPASLKLLPLYVLALLKYVSTLQQVEMF